MNRKKIKLSSYILITIVLAFGLSLSLQFLLADWSAPIATPPEGNQPPPLFNDGLETLPVVAHPLAVTGGLSVGDIIQMNNTRITGVGMPTSNSDAATKSFVDSVVSTFRCSRLKLYEGATQAYCGENEKFLTAGCRTYQLDNWGADTPVMLGRPVISAGRPGFSCSYQTKEFNADPDQWFGPYGARAYVVCCADESGSLPQTYTCEGSVPFGSVECKDDTFDLTSTLTWLGVGTASTSCTTTRKCEYWTPPYECAGTDFTNSTMCTGDDTGLTFSVTKTLVDSCTSGTKCEMTCNSGYYRSGSDCFPDKVCTGTDFTNSTMCTGDDTGLTADTPKTLVDSCTSGTKCEMTCNSGYVRSGSVCVPITYACTGSNFANSIMCTGDDTGLTADTPKTLVDSCTSGTKCEMICASPYYYDGGICVTCSNECSVSMCSGGSRIPCGNYDADPCTEYGTPIVCSIECVNEGCCVTDLCASDYCDPDTEFLYCRDNCGELHFSKDCADDAGIFSGTTNVSYHNCDFSGGVNGTGYYETWQRKAFWSGECDNNRCGETAFPEEYVITPVSCNSSQYLYCPDEYNVECRN